MIGRNLASVSRQGGRAAFRGDVAEDFVESAIFFDDDHDVFDLFGDRCFGSGLKRVLPNLGGSGGEVRWQGQDLQRTTTALGLKAAFKRLFERRVRARACTFGVDDMNLCAVHRDARREPSGGDVPERLGGIWIDDGDGVEASERNQQAVAVVHCHADGQRAAQGLESRYADGDGCGDGKSPGIDHAHGVVVTVGDIDTVCGGEYA